MAYRPVTAVRVEALGASWWITGSDADNASLLSTLMASQSGLSGNLTDLPQEVIVELCKFFDASVKRWEGVLAPEQEDGGAGDAPWDCTLENRQQLPTMDKVQVMVAYVLRLAEILGNAPSAPEPPTSSTAPGALSTEPASASVSPSTHTSAPSPCSNLTEVVGP